MQQPNLIKINETIINLNLVTNVTIQGDQIRFEFNFSEQEDEVALPAFQIEFGDNALKAYDYLKAQCVAVFDDSTEVPPQSEDFINPDWTRQRVIGIKYDLSSNGNPTWYLDLEGVENKHFIRQSNKSQWLKHYPQLEDMQLGNAVGSSDVDIIIYTMPQTDKPQFLETMKVVPDGKLQFMGLMKVFPGGKLEASTQRKAEVAAALTAYDQWTYLDLETTGMLSDDEIMQIGLIYRDGDNAQILNKRDILVNPIDAQKVYRVQKNNKSAYNIHGISPEQVANAEPFPTHYEMIREAIHGKPLATYSTFDLKMLNQVCAMHNLEQIVPSEHIDLIKLFAKYIGVPGFKAGDYKWQSLEDAHKSILGEPLEGAHAAITDAQAMRNIAQHIVELSTADEPF